MATDLSKSFRRQFESDVHLSYQRMGSKLRNTVRSRNGVEGDICVFQAVGRGAASTKSRHGKVPVMNASHRAVECRLYDYYAGDWVDQLDEQKIAHDERSVIANSGAYALGRKTDELIIDALDGNTEMAVAVDASPGSGLTAAEGLTKERILRAFETLGEADVPDDGDRFAIIGWRQWGQLLEIEEFANADYVGPDELPWKGTQAKHWLGTLWMPHSGLTKAEGKRLCYWYHKTAIGHAIGQDVKSDITWHGDRAAHFVNNMMSQGAVVIDPSGIIRLPCTEA